VSRKTSRETRPSSSGIAVPKAESSVGTDTSRRDSNFGEPVRRWARESSQTSACTGSSLRKHVRTSRYDGRRPGSSDVRPLPGGREAVLASQVNPRYPDYLVARRVTGAAAATKWLGAIASCLRGDRGRQRSERLGSGSSSVHSRATRGVSIRDRAAPLLLREERLLDVQRPDGGFAETKGRAETSVDRSGQ